ncbi:MAG TPA: DUF1614 domain-containing protein [Bacillota bacterium]|mgnify:CR=1 FL=1|jgi:uncharacterized membrane protein|nr:DUF1614 domain-containing protein [Bacillota bacterium]HOB86724.1 DUF1614 domain-containing protein [Bacillota bacterium]HOP69211.1 DUF1614 domain-containing protein [Bacillota bacterium]HPT34239.1 DUF1614 domain-containing protein [Bacillota bacterium]HPZ65107.1 DUF1614 domain-containing protein [Bacillota bacterium]
MPAGAIILLIVAILIFLGLAQRVLDRLHLSDREALLFVLAMLVGGFLPDIPLTQTLSINIGGGIIPLILVIYLFIKAGTAAERSRAAVALLVTAVVVYIFLKLFPLEPTYAVLMDPMYLVAIIAGVAGYLAGRSRRSAFIAGVGSVFLNDLFTRLELFFTGARSELVIGGAGIFDAVVVSGLIALGLAELIGEIRERLAAEPGKGYPEELSRGLEEPREEGNHGEEES